MSTRIERLRSYEGQLIRAFDFEAEQRYHNLMRRRLNRALHLYGIVFGMEVAGPSGPLNEFAIAPGLAIDRLGREIFLFAARQLDDEVLTQNNAQPGNKYDVWLRFTETPATPAAAGFRVCNVADQFTRMRETVTVALRPVGSPAWTDDNPLDESTPFGDAGVFVGTITLDGTGAVSAAAGDGRTYIGLRAHDIVAPVRSPPAPTTPFVLDGTGPDKLPHAVNVRDPLFATSHLVVGENFPIDKGKIKPPPTPSLAVNGHAKVASDLFVKGTSYLPDPDVTDGWLSLSQYIKRFTPEFIVQEVTISPTPSGTTTVGPLIETVTVTAKRVQGATQVAVIGSVTAVEFHKPPTAATNFKIDLDCAATAKSGASYEATIKWSVSPTVAAVAGPGPGATPGDVYIDKLRVRLLLIISP